VRLEQTFLSEDLLCRKSAGHKDPEMFFREGSCHLLKNEVECHGPACSEWTGVFHIKPDCYVPVHFLHPAVLPGELEGSSSVCGKAMNFSFALFGILIATHCSHSLLPYPRNHFVHRGDI